MTDIKAVVKSFAESSPSGALVLDVGCGLRPYESFFDHAKYIGVDVPNSGRESEGKRPDFEFDGIYLPFPDQSFDEVICTEVLEHAVNPDALLKEINRVLKPSGRLLITVPFIWGLHELPYDFRRYTEVGIRAAVEAAAFTVVEQRKLTPGLAAIQMLISSETNFYLKHVAPAPRSLFTRCLLRLQNRLLRYVYFIWKYCLQFERVYIDNMVLARKAPENLLKKSVVDASNSIVQRGRIPVAALSREKSVRFVEKTTTGQEHRAKLIKVKSALKGLIGK